MCVCVYVWIWHLCIFGYGICVCLDPHFQVAAEAGFDELVRQQQLQQQMDEWEAGRAGRLDHFGVLEALCSHRFLRYVVIP